MTAKPEIHILPSSDEIARAAAGLVVETARERLKQGKVFSLALSGGKTPEKFLRLLSTHEYSEHVSWESTHIFQVDERCVPPTDPQSNFRMIEESLLSRLRNGVPQIHRMKAEAHDLDEASQDYENEIRRTLAATDQNVPPFDLIFLGLGADGHTASLFPGTEALTENERWVRPNYVEKLQMNRMTMTYPLLNAAATAAFLVSGAEKANAARAVLEGPEDQAKRPAQGIKPQGKLIWYIDEAAAHLLSKK